MTKRVRQFRDLQPGDVFTIRHENDGRQYMKLADYGAVDVETHADCIPSPKDRCIYRYTVDTRNNIHYRKA